MPKYVYPLLRLYNDKYERSRKGANWKKLIELIEKREDDVGKELIDIKPTEKLFDI